NVLHLHRFEHEERRAARNLLARLCQDARDRSRHGRNDSSCCRGLTDLACERVDPEEVKTPASRLESELTIRPRRRCLLAHITSRHDEISLFDRIASQRSPRTCKFHGRSIAPIPQHGFILTAMPAKAQTAAAAPGQRPANLGIPW